MPIADSARPSTWAIVAGVALAADGLCVGSTRLAATGVAIAFTGLVAARVGRRFLGRSHGRTARFYSSTAAHGRRTLKARTDGERWENEGGAPRTA
jgi:membrane protein implicated in regulation of membrane protease activity